MINKKKGFTLIELLVVIAIIGILSSVVLASLNSARTKSRDTKRVADLKQLQVAYEMYFDSCRQYPPTQTGNVLPPLTTNTGCPSGTTLASFISAVPADPLNSGTQVYRYASPSTSTYCITSDMEGTPIAGSTGCAISGVTSDYSVSQ